MTKDEIAKFADAITTTNQRTIICFHESENSNGIVGYFDNNHLKEMREKNIWNFVRTPIFDVNNKYSLINGVEVKKICIFSI